MGKNKIRPPAPISHGSCPGISILFWSSLILTTYYWPLDIWPIRDRKFLWGSIIYLFIFYIFYWEHSPTKRHVETNTRQDTGDVGTTCRCTGSNSTDQGSRRNKRVIIKSYSRVLFLYSIGFNKQANHALWIRHCYKCDTIVTDDQVLYCVSMCSLVQCGVVAWKSFRQTTGRNYRPSWNVMYNKTRSNTVLRVTYTSAFGSHRTSGWNSFTISILINNTECQDPAPIRSGGSGYTSTGEDHSVTPGSISGICNINIAGPLKLSTKFTQYSSSRNMYDGYNPNGANREVATFHVEELCSN